MQIEMLFGKLLAAEVHYRLIRESDRFTKVAQHHHAAQRRGKRRDQEPVIPARASARNRSGRESAETVRNEPLAREQHHRVGTVGFRSLRPGQPVLNDMFNRQFFFHTSPLRNVREWSKYRFSASAEFRTLDIGDPRLTIASPM